MRFNGGYYCLVTTEMPVADLGASLTTTKTGGTLETVASVTLWRMKDAVKKTGKEKSNHM